MSTSVVDLLGGVGDCYFYQCCSIPPLHYALLAVHSLGTKLKIVPSISRGSK